MELVKENNKRWIIFISFILVLVYIFLLFVSKVSILISTSFIFAMIAFFSSIFYSRKKNCLIYFSANGIKFEVGNKKNEFKWNDLKIDLEQDYIKYLNSIGYKFSSIENNKNNLLFSICWENEKSIIELTQKYVPKNHDFYRLVSEYAEKRGLKF